MPELSNLASRLINQAQLDATVATEEQPEQYLEALVSMAHDAVRRTTEVDQDMLRQEVVAEMRREYGDEWIPEDLVI